MTDEKRVWNPERHGYDVEGPCWECRQPISYFLDEFGSPRDIKGIAAQQERERWEETLEDRLTEAMEAGVLPDDFYETYPVEPYGPEETCFNTRGYASALAEHLLAGREKL